MVDAGLGHAYTSFMPQLKTKLFKVSKDFYVEDVEFILTLEEDFSPIRGSFATGNDEEDKRLEDQIIEASENSLWAWCCVVVTASWGGMEGTATIGGVSVLPGSGDGFNIEDTDESKEDYFRKHMGYFEDMKEEALDDLKRNISENGWTVS